MESANKLYRSSRERALFGVAGGLAEYFNVDTVVVRLVFVVFTLASSGIGVLIYILLALITPKSPSNMDQPAQALESTPDDEESGRSPPPEPLDLSRRRNSLILILIAGGLLVLGADVFGFWWIGSGGVWPLLPVALAVGFILGVAWKSRL